MATAEEKFRGVSGNTTNRRIQYVVKDAADDKVAISTTLAACPEEYDGIPLTDIEVEELSFPLGLFLTTAVYTSDKPDKKETDTTEISFDVSLTTQHITQSLQTISRHVATDNPFGEDLNIGGLIGTDVNNKNPEGIDIRVPIGAFQVTWYAPDAAITPTYRRTLLETVGKVNNASFYGHDAGEVLFVGSSGQLRSEGDWQITYRFEVNANRSDVTVAAGTDYEIEVGDVDGWDVLWVKYKQVDLTDRQGVVPEQVCVERVYERADLAAVLGI